MKTPPRLPTTRNLLAGAFCALAFALGAWPALACSPPAVTLRVAPERDLVYRDGPREVIVEVEIKGAKPQETFRTPVNLSVVLDHSGSMAGAKIEKARQAACVALDRLEPDDTFSLVIFDNTAEVILPPERAGSREHRDEMKARIERIQPGGSTALYAGVELGAKQVRKCFDKERVNRVILLSDGLANVGPKNTSDLVRLGSGLRGEGLSVTTIGLGDDFNEDLMTGLAEASHANYYYVRDAEKLPGIFGDELGSATSRIASEIRIRIEVPKGVRLREIIGHPEIHCEEGAAEISLPELFGSEDRLFHLRCRLDETAADTASLASVSLSYDDLAQKERASFKNEVSVHLTCDAEKSTASVHDETARNIAVLSNRLTKEAAVKLADEGRAKEAATLLQRQIIANASAPATQQLPGVSDENRKLEGYTRELTTKGNLDNTSRKAAQWDNYQDRYQLKR